MVVLIKSYVMGSLQDHFYKNIVKINYMYL